MDEITLLKVVIAYFLVSSVIKTFIILSLQGKVDRLKRQCSITYIGKGKPTIGELSEEYYLMDTGI